MTTELSRRPEGLLEILIPRGSLTEKIFGRLIVIASLTALAGGVYHADQKRLQKVSEDTTYCQQMEKDYGAESLTRIIAPKTDQYCSELIKPRR
ncbi:hypothetical protein HYT52_04360 [Candidatus Woesearchaeota archaeon]|nr:hypothetical protein [Candidatus Woesearchaeota archaeon]